MITEEYDEDDFELKHVSSRDLEYIQESLVELLHMQEEILKIVEDIYEHQRKK